MESRLLPHANMATNHRLQRWRWGALVPPHEPTRKVKGTKPHHHTSFRPPRRRGPTTPDLVWQSVSRAGKMRRCTRISPCGTNRINLAIFRPTVLCARHDLECAGLGNGAIGVLLLSPFSLHTARTHQIEGRLELCSYQPLH